MEAFLGLGIATFGIFILIWYILQVVGYWKLFEKAGKPGWHSIIPILNTYDQFDLCWNGIFGVIYMVGLFASSYLSRMGQENQTMSIVAGVIGFVCLVIDIIGNYKLAKAFDRGIGTFIGLMLLPPIFMMILGFGDAQYVGKDQ